jgi:hypothetical protein
MAGRGKERPMRWMMAWFIAAAMRGPRLMVSLAACLSSGCTATHCYADVPASSEQFRIVTTCERPCTLRIENIEYSPDAAGHVQVMIPRQNGGCTQVVCGVMLHDGSPREPVIEVRLDGDVERILLAGDIDRLPTNDQGERVLELRCSHWSHK